MALINYNDYFGFDDLDRAIKQAEKANKDFGTSAVATSKQIQQSYNEATKELNDYLNTLKNFNVNQKNAATSIAGISTEVTKLTTKQVEQKKIIQDTILANDLLERSVSDLKITQAALIKEYESLGNTEAKDVEYKKQIQQQVVQLKNAISAQNIVVKTGKAVVDAANGSYNKLQQELKQVGLQLKALPNAFDPVTGKINKQNKEAVELNAKYLQLTTSLKTADAGFGQFFRNVGNYEGAFKKLTVGVGNFASSLLAAAGITTGLFGFVSFLKDSVTQSLEAEAAASRLQNTLKNIGREDAFDRLKAKAVALRDEFGTFDDDEVVQVFQSLIVYGKLTEKQINELLPVIINFAAQQRISLSEASGVIIKALEGNGRALKDYGVNIKDAKDTTEAFGLVMTQLAPRVEGAAKAFGETTAGQIKKTEVEIENLKEQIGNELQPVIKTFYEFIHGAISGLGQLFNDTGDSFSQLGKDIKFNAVLISKLFTEGAGGAAAYYESVREQGEKNIDNQKRQEIEQFALTNAQALGTRTLKEQVTAYEQLQGRWEKTKESVIELSKAHKLDTEEGKQQLLLLHQQKVSLVELNKVIAQTTAAKKGGILGPGDPNDPFGKSTTTKTKPDHSAEDDAKKQLLALQQYEQTRIQINIDALQRIANDESNSILVRINALSKLGAAEKDLATTRGEGEIEANKLTGNEVLAVREKVKQEILRVEADTNTAIGVLIKKEADAKIKAQNDVLNARSAAIKQEAKLLNDAAEAQRQKDLEEAENRKKIMADVFNTFNASLNALGNVTSSEIADVFGSLTVLIQDVANDSENTLNDLLYTAGAVGNAITDQFTQASERRIANLEKDKDHELAIVGNNAAAQAAIQERYAKEEAKIKRKEATANKINALFQIAINTAVAATKTLGETGIFGIPLLPIIIGLGAAEAAVVLAQPLPQFEKGTENAPEGYAVVDERGSELIVDRHGRLKEVGGAGPRVTYLDQGDKVLTATKTKELLTQHVIEKQDEYNIMREMKLNATLSNRIQQGRQAAAIYTMSEAFKATGINHGLLSLAFKDAVKDIPIFQTIFDENGIQERERRRDGLTTFRNTYNLSYRRNKN